MTLQTGGTGPMLRDPAISALALGQTLIWASIYYVFPALLLRWEQDLGWSKTELTGAIALAVLVSALASPLSGRVIDMGRGAALLSLSAALGAGGLFALSYISALWQFYLIWAIIGGAMAGCLYEPCFAIVTRARGVEARRGIILITLVAGFAGTLSFPTTHALAEAFGWRHAVQVLAGLVALVVVPLLWFGARQLERGRPQAPVLHETPEAPRAFLRRPAFWCLALAFSCFAVAHGSTLHHLLPLLDERGLPPDMAVLVASFIGPMQVAGRMAMMLSERYISTHGVAIAAFLSMALSVLLLLLGAHSPASLTGFVLLFGSAVGVVSILRPLLAREILGAHNFGAKTGALALPFLAGSALSPFLGALLWKTGGYALMLAALVLVLGVGCLLYLGAHRLGRAR
ncbi:MFS transporter [Aliiroseovarius crassostreae]|uniref:MFS transporter n=2 Tax=Aliiroseovarius crassostreae TaxID=154981 RepID=UPI0021B07BDD|nr:MFS transporter [Aliiroseovarius crassostreae]UWP97612.1 MFS transporter [Aliiroseovarius crassostreae]